MGTKRRLLTKVLVAAVLAVVAVVAPAATPAQAVTACNTPTYLYGWKLPNYVYACEYGYTQQLYDRRMHVFVVSYHTGEIVHNWQVYEGGPWRIHWVGLGGVGRSAVGTTTGSTSGRLWLNINVVGTDGRYYCKIYNHPRAPSGTWWPSQTTWALGSVCW